MTVKMLKEMLADLPDDARIYADDGTNGSFEGNSEFVEMCYSPQFPKIVIFQTRYDFDYVEELAAKLEHYSEECWDEKDVVNNLSEHGYVAEDFDDDDDIREWAYAAADTYGWDTYIS
jgi:hypothetical protein